MNISFAIHGTPGKSECWGISNDETYLKSFYDEANNATELTRLDIDFRVVDGTVCSYYHYLKLKNISNGIARSGGYFGMSIRFEGAYCLDVGNMFKMMNQLFEQVVCKSILKSDGTNTEYNYSSFKQCQAELENIRNLASNALEKFSNDIRPFPNGYAPKHTDSIRKYNVADTGSESFHDMLLKSAEVYVSPEYPLLSSKMLSLEKDNNAKSEYIKEQQAVISRQQGDIGALNTKISTQNQTIKTQEDRIGQQATELSQKKQKISDLEGRLNLAGQSIAQQKEQIAEFKKKLNEALSNHDIQEINNCILMLRGILDKKKESLSLLSSIKSDQKQYAQTIDNAQKQVAAIQKELKDIKDSQFETTRNDPNVDNKTDDNNKLKWEIPAAAVGVLALLALLYFLIFGGSNNGDENKKIVSGNPNIEFAEFKKSTEERFEQIDIKLSSILSANSSIQNTQTAIETNVDVQGEVPKTITWINLKDNSKVSPGKSYTLAVQTGDASRRTTINGGGHFECSQSQATISNDNGSTCNIKVNDNASGSLEVWYVVDQKVVKRRIIKISQ